MKPTKHTILRSVANVDHIKLCKIVKTDINKNPQDFQLIYNSLHSDKIKCI